MYNKKSIADKHFKKLSADKSGVRAALKHCNANHAVKTFPVTFKRIYFLWTEEISIKNKQSTCARYRYVTEKYLFPFFENMKVSEIKESHINNMVKKLYLSDNLSPKTVQDILSILKQIMLFAKKQGCSCCTDYSVVRPFKQKNDFRILSVGDQERLVSYLKSNLNCQNMGILLSLFMGLRLGELCALKWSDFDFENKTIIINKTMQRIENFNGTKSARSTKIIIDTPKTQNSSRKIPVPDFLLEDLQVLSLGQKPDNYFLSGDSQKYTDPRTYQNRFKKILKKANVENINFHALRHTFATRAVEQDFDEKSLSEILGHSKVGFTLERYVHPSFDLKKQNMEKLKNCY